MGPIETLLLIGVGILLFGSQLAPMVGKMFGAVEDVKKEVKSHTKVYKDAANEIKNIAPSDTVVTSEKTI